MWHLSFFISPLSSSHTFIIIIIVFIIMSPHSTHQFHLFLLLLSHWSPWRFSYLLRMLRQRPSSFLMSATSCLSAWFSLSRKAARTEIWFSFKRRASRERLAASLFLHRRDQYLSSWKRETPLDTELLTLPCRKWSDPGPEVRDNFYQLLILLPTLWLPTLRSAGTSILRAFLIMGCGLSSSSLKRCLRGSKASWPGTLDRATSAASGSKPPITSGPLDVGVMRGVQDEEETEEPGEPQSSFMLDWLPPERERIGCYFLIKPLYEPRDSM